MPSVSNVEIKYISKLQSRLFHSSKGIISGILHSGVVQSCLVMFDEWFTQNIDELKFIMRKN